FLAMRTVQDENNRNMFVKGMVYAIDMPLMRSLKSIRAENANKVWVGVDLEDIYLNGIRHPIPHRAITFRGDRWVTDPSIIDALDSLVVNIRSGAETVTKVAFRNE